MRDLVRAVAAVFVAMVVCLAPQPAGAQGSQDGRQARVTAGPLGFTPSVELTGGVDTNVYNQPRQEAVEDVVIRVTPQVNLWLRLSRLKFHTVTSVGSVYFRRAEDQRALYLQSQSRVDVSLYRFEPYSTVTLSQTRENASLDLAAAALRLERRFEAGSVLRLTPKAGITIAGHTGFSGFAEDQHFDGVDLQESLNRSASGATLGVRLAATPLTTISISAGMERQRFDFLPERDGNSLRLTPTVNLSPFALISGRAMIGIRKFDASNPSVPDYLGMLAALDLSYIARGSTRFSFRADRDLDFSYEPSQPYFVLTSFHLTVTQRITDTLDAAPSIGLQRLAYRRLDSKADDLLTGDMGLTIGIRTSQVVQRRTRVTWTAEYLRRRSNFTTRAYDGLRVNMSVNYGL